MSVAVTRWWWIRHAPVAGDDATRVNGRKDVDVDLSGAARLSALAACLPKAALWVATPLSRTVKTAKALFAAGAAEHPLAIRADLAEQDFGGWTGRTWAEIDEDPAARAFWDNPAHARTPGGESFADQVARTGAAMLALSAENPGADIVAVAHAGTIRAALAVALDVDPAAAMAFKVDPLSLTRMDHVAGRKTGWRGGAWAIGCVNETAEGRR